jgi:hypothetical protein
MTHPNHSSGRTMKFMNSDSTAAAGGSIPVGMHTHASRTKRMARSLKATLALTILSGALFLVPGQAFAGDPCSDTVQAQYGQKTQQCLAAGLGAGKGGGGAPAEEVAVPVQETASGPSLPFTGLDVAALAVVALALTGTGVVLRRLATIGDSEK